MEKMRSRGGRNRGTARLLTQRFVSLYTLFGGLSGLCSVAMQSDRASRDQPREERRHEHATKDVGRQTFSAARAIALPDEKGLAAHAYDGASAAVALGPARFVVMRLVRGGLPPGPARERTGQVARSPGARKLIAVYHDEKLDIRAMQLGGRLKSFQRRSVREREQSAGPLVAPRPARLVVERPYGADVRARAEHE